MNDEICLSILRAEVLIAEVRFAVGFGQGI
jgi:hypothetical protein